MKLLQLSKTTSGEFEGRTFDEALRLARQELGAEALIRCWRVRRGGVFGFFAKESFVAGLTAPAGAEPSRQRGGGQEESTPEAPSHLYDLVEATTDEVTLESDLDLDRDFSRVLAEAEAALIDAVESTEVLVPNGQPIDSAAEQFEGLSASLARLGVPSDYLPDIETLDALAHSLATLPSAPPMTKVEGSLLVVVGPRRDALATAHHALANLDLDASDLIAGERSSSVRQRVKRRQGTKKMTVLVVEASMRSRELDQIASWIEKLKPEYVLAALPATVKRPDFERWHAQLGRVEALALSRPTESTSLGEWMGHTPIAMLDGAQATTLRWVTLLLNAKMEGER